VPDTNSLAHVVKGYRLLAAMIHRFTETIASPVMERIETSRRSGRRSARCHVTSRCAFEANIPPSGPLNPPSFFSRTIPSMRRSVNEIRFAILRTYQNALGIGLCENSDRLSLAARTIAALC
jgi:hypothetical protein